MVTGQHAGTLIDPERPCFDAMPGYLPVVGGIRHVTAFHEPPATDTVVEALCGARLVASRHDRGEPEQVADCRFCAFELCDVDPPPLPTRVPAPPAWRP